MQVLRGFEPLRFSFAAARTSSTLIRSIHTRYYAQRCFTHVLGGARGANRRLGISQDSWGQIHWGKTNNAKIKIRFFMGLLNRGPGNPRCNEDYKKAQKWTFQIMLMWFKTKMNEKSCLTPKFCWFKKSVSRKVLPQNFSERLYPGGPPLKTRAVFISIQSTIPLTNCLSSSSGC